MANNEVPASMPWVRHFDRPTTRALTGRFGFWRTMFSKLLAIALGLTVVGHLFFRPQLKQLGRRIDGFVTLMVVAIVVTWLGQVAYLLLFRE